MRVKSGEMWKFDAGDRWLPTEFTVLSFKATNDCDCYVAITSPDSHGKLAVNADFEPLPWGERRVWSKV